MVQEDSTEAWPELPWDAWKASCDTLHLWMQVVGKVKLALSPFLNEWWNVGFDVTARGLTTSTIPLGSGAFEIDFDFIDHDLTILTSTGTKTSLSLAPCSVADFHRELPRFFRLAEDQENIACGFWPGNPNAAGVELGEPAFYSYLPAVPGYREASVEPSSARYDERLNEFVLPYEDVRRMPSPERAILDFFQSTYEAGATLARWDRTVLEHPSEVPRPARAMRPEDVPGRGGGPGAADARRH